MNPRGRAAALPKPIDAALREFVNALGKSTMYPPGHQFVLTSARVLAGRFATALGDRTSITLGVTPRGLLLDGLAVEPLPAMLREFAVRLHRKNVGTIFIEHGAGEQEIAAMLAALAPNNADETVGREGIRLQHIRVEPLVYDVLAFADPTLDQELDDVFWAQLVEAAFGRRLAEGEAAPSALQIAEAITERAAQSPEGARRVYQALASFSSALVARGDRAGGARKRFVDVLSALSRPTTTRVVAAAPSPASRRRFLRETLDLVPPALLLQVLESVAEADGEPISPQLRWLLGKLAGGEAQGGAPASGTGMFANEVAGLVEQWEGVATEADEEEDPRVGMEPARVIAIGLELSLPSESVITAARTLSERGQLLKALELLDNPQNDVTTARTIADAVLAPELLDDLLRATPVDFPLVTRIALHTGADAVGQVLDALGRSEDRGTRRRLLDLLVKIGPAAESALQERLVGAPWYLARNILATLAQFPHLSNPEPVLQAFNDPEPRVRLEALKVLIRQANLRERAATEALESGEEPLIRLALTSFEGACPPALVAPLLAVLSGPNEDLQLHAIRLLADSNNPLVVPQLLTLVRSRSGFLRRQRLLPKSPVMLAALEVLARRWPNHRPVLAALQLAAKSGDAEVRVAGGGRG